MNIQGRLESWVWTHSSAVASPNMHFTAWDAQHESYSYTWKYSLVEQTVCWTSCENMCCIHHCLLFISLKTGRELSVYSKPLFYVIHTGILMQLQIESRKEHEEVTDEYLPVVFTCGSSLYFSYYYEAENVSKPNITDICVLSCSPHELLALQQVGENSFIHLTYVE